MKRVQSKSVTPPKNLLDGLRGIGKDLFKSLGGGEELIRRERESFNTVGEGILLEAEQIRSAPSNMKAR